MINEQLLQMVGKEEKILWSGKPDKLCFILEGIFNPLLLVAIVWGMIDSSLIGSFTSGLSLRVIAFIIIPFFLLHLLPVWLYLGWFLTLFRNYKNTSYIITDKAVYISRGVISITAKTKPFSELSHINIQRGFFDQLLGVGDVTIANNIEEDFIICDIREYNDVYQLIKKLQTDIYSDTMYPNDLRPAENPGYHTKYIDG